MQCIILAGGLGTRLYPLTQTIPKALIDVNDKPFLYYQLNYLKALGINDIILCIGHYGYMIKDFIYNNSFDLNIQFTEEKELLGTAGAIRLAFDEHKLKDEFFVIYGDTFLPIDFNEVYKSFNNDALMTIFWNRNSLDKSNVKLLKSGILYDKQNADENYTYIDYGLSILTKDIVENYIPSNTKYDLSIVFNQLSLENKLQGYEVFTRFYEIGSFSGLNDFKEYLNGKNNNT